MLQRKKPLASKGRTFAKRYDAFEYERDDIYNHIVPEEVEIAGTKIVSLASLMPQQDSSNGSSSNSGSSSSSAPYSRPIPRSQQIRQAKAQARARKKQQQQQQQQLQQQHELEQEPVPAAQQGRAPLTVPLPARTDVPVTAEGDDIAPWEDTSSLLAPPPAFADAADDIPVAGGGLSHEEFLALHAAADSEAEQTPYTPYETAFDSKSEFESYSEPEPTSVSADDPFAYGDSEEIEPVPRRFAKRSPTRTRTSKSWAKNSDSNAADSMADAEADASADAEGYKPRSSFKSRRYGQYRPRNSAKAADLERDVSADDFTASFGNIGDGDGEGNSSSAHSYYSKKPRYGYGSRRGGLKYQSELDDSVENAVNYMVRLLTAREHSAQELRTKCSKRFTAQTVEAALERCVERGYQSESRYGQMLVRHMEYSRYGPMKLSFEARRKGVDQSLINEMSSDIDWDELAYEALVKKYGVQVLDFATQRKALAYLGRRGFGAGSCMNAMERMQREAKEQADE